MNWTLELFASAVLLTACNSEPSSELASRSERGRPASTDHRRFPAAGTDGHFAYEAVRESLFSWVGTARPSSAAFIMSTSFDVALTVNGSSLA